MRVIPPWRGTDPLVGMWCKDEWMDIPPAAATAALTGSMVSCLILCWVSSLFFTCFRSLALRFWNHILTCEQDIFGFIPVVGFCSEQPLRLIRFVEKKKERIGMKKFRRYGKPPLMVNKKKTFSELVLLAFYGTGKSFTIVPTKTGPFKLLSFHRTGSYLNLFSRSYFHPLAIRLISCQSCLLSRADHYLLFEEEQMKPSLQLVSLVDLIKLNRTHLAFWKTEVGS